ncbi:MAG TPA: hotdog domain-containing protein [Gemmataceae bacterium]|jgi:3-hydroxyacyl-[acyl-carrier-protein] dehydratase|nr:hotdog domain-containing protein [Gemmataceae bacterium]
MPPPPILDPAEIDCSRPIVGIEQIRAVNMQRFEMEALTAIVLLDPARKLVVGYKDASDKDFWVRGHMPGFPIMPGVMICEAAAQLCSYYVATQKIFDSDFVGLGGMDEVHFRYPVFPGERLVLVAQVTREKRFIAQSDVQGFVGSKMVFDAKVSGIPLRRE